MLNILLLVLGFRTVAEHRVFVRENGERRAEAIDRTGAALQAAIRPLDADASRVSRCLAERRAPNDRTERASPSAAPRAERSVTTRCFGGTAAPLRHSGDRSRRDSTRDATMRGDRAARDNRHNKDHDNLKSSLKKGSKSKKNRVVFDESANEFFEADYIIVVRDECGYSDEGESEECSGCGACERYQEPEQGALSPPEGYKDMGLFNRDGTLREQAWWETGDVLLVGERSGTVFTPQHLQLLRRLQRERMLRSTICADCDAHAALHQPLGESPLPRRRTNADRRAPNAPRSAVPSHSPHILHLTRASNSSQGQW